MARVRLGEAARRLLRRPPVLSRPQIEVTTHCNLKCVECPRTVDLEQGIWRNEHMPLDRFARVVARLPPAACLILQGVGESSLHPRFREMVALARHSGKFTDIALSTNGLTRDAAYFADLARLGLTGINISVDSLDPATAEKCRSGTRVDKLKRRIGEFAARFPNVTIAIVASRHNLDDIPRTLEILDTLGRFEVQVQPVIDYRGDGAGLNRPGLVRLRKLLGRAVGACANLRLALAGGAMEGGPARRCTRPYMSPYVTVGGYLTPCCTIQDPAVFGYVDLVDRSFAQAWSAPSVQAWLGDFLIADAPFCAGCFLNPSPSSPSPP